MSTVCTHQIPFGHNRGVHHVLVVVPFAALHNVRTLGTLVHRQLCLIQRHSPQLLVTLLAPVVVMALGVEVQHVPLLKEGNSFIYLLYLFIMETPWKTQINSFIHHLLALFRVRGYTTEPWSASDASQRYGLLCVVADDCVEVMEKAEEEE